ncbi:MAG: coiled-coil domain-containing protein [Betaproteobacteria bacterium]
MGILHRYEQFATKADFKVLSRGVRTQLDHLEGTTGRLEKKTDRLEEKTDRLEARTSRLEAKTDRLDAKVDHLEGKVDHLDQKVSRFEVKMTAEIADLKITMQSNLEHCKNEFASLRADIAALTNSHKYVLWIGGVLATMCMSFFGLCLSILIPTLK